MSFPPTKRFPGIYVALEPSRRYMERIRELRAKELEENTVDEIFTFGGSHEEDKDELKNSFSKSLGRLSISEEDDGVAEKLKTHSLSTQDHVTPDNNIESNCEGKHHVIEETIYLQVEKVTKEIIHNTCTSVSVMDTSTSHFEEVKEIKVAAEKETYPITEEDMVIDSHDESQDESKDNLNETVVEMINTDLHDVTKTQPIEICTKPDENDIVDILGETVVKLTNTDLHDETMAQSIENCDSPGEDTCIGNTVEVLASQVGDIKHSPVVATSVDVTRANMQPVRRMKLSDRFAEIERQKKEQEESLASTFVKDEIESEPEDVLPCKSTLKLSERFSYIHMTPDNSINTNSNIESASEQTDKEVEMESGNDEAEKKQEKDASFVPQAGPSNPNNNDVSNAGCTVTNSNRVKNDSSLVSQENSNTQKDDDSLVSMGNVSTANSDNSSTSREMSTHTTNPQISTSPTSFLDYTDDEDDDDDDDDLLHTAPAFLKSIQEITNQPSPEPSSDHSAIFNSSIDSACGSPLLQRHSATSQTNQKSQFCLDNLLMEFNDEAQHVRDYNEMKSQLRTDGGFVNILEKGEEASVEEVSLQQDQEQILKQLNEVEIDLPMDRPGVDVFDVDQYGCMFDSSLHPCQCGFTVGDNGTAIERYVQTITPDKYVMMVESDILSMCFSKIVCQNQLLRWLFFIMSIDHSFLLRDFCNKTLLNIIHQQRVAGGKIWSPSITDFITVLCNFGASLDSLIPKQLETMFSIETLRNKLLKQPKDRETGVQRCDNVKKEDIKEQIQMVLQIVSVSLMNNRNDHNPKESKLYLLVLTKLALDPVFKNLFSITKLESCIDMVLENYTVSEWEQERISICRVLVTVATHHHDMAHLSNLLPEGARGVYVQRRLSYLMLKSLLLEEDVTDTQLHNLEIKDLFQFVPIMASLLLEDIYRLSSVVTLLDKCVASNYPLASKDRDELKSLIEIMRKLRVKDNVALINRTKVKDMLVRVTTFWSLNLQTFKGIQTKIFEYAAYKSPVKMKIEKIELHSSDISDDNLSEDDNDLPCKMPKLS